MFSKKIQHTKFHFVKGDHLAYTSDVLVNWTSTSLLEGDEIFVRTVKEGGSLITKDLLHAKTLAQSPNVSMSQIVITSAGVLTFKKIIHAVLPNYRVKAEKEAKLSHLQTTLRNLFFAIQNNKDQLEIVRTITITTIPTKLYGNLTPACIPTFIDLIKTFSTQSKLRDVYIVCSEENYNIYTKEFNKQTSSKFERFLQFLHILK